MMDDMEEIWVLYADDGAQALDTAEQALQDIVGGTPEAMADGVASLFRSVHTFKGNARVLGLSNAESRAHVTEDLMGLIRDHGAPWDDEIEQILVLAIDRLRDILEQTASQRRDIEEDFAADLMRLVSSKIERIEAGVLQGTKPHAPPVDDVQDDAVVAVPPAVPARENKAVALLTQIAGPLDQLGQLRSQPDSAADCAQILRNIATLAEGFGYVRLADVALAVAGQAAPVPPLADARLYEELLAIELSLSTDVLPHPAPHAVYQHWCAVNADSLFTALRGSFAQFAKDTANQTHRNALGQTLRQLSQACRYHGLNGASDWAMTLQEALSAGDLAKGLRPDQPIFQMLHSFAVTTVAIIFEGTTDGGGPLPSIGFRPDIQAGLLDEPSITELQTLNLPLSLLLGLSADIVQTILQAGRAGCSFWVSPLDLDQMAAATAVFCTLGEDDQIRLLAMTPLRSGASVRVQILLASRLTADQVQARFVGLTPQGLQIPLQPLGPAASPAPPPPEQGNDGLAGVSVEMLETLGDVSADLTQLAQRLDEILNPQDRENASRGDVSFPNDPSHSGLPDQFTRMVEGIESSVSALELLSQRVSDLQEDAMVSRLRPAEGSLAPVIAGLGRTIRAIAPGIALSFVSDDLLLDNQNLDLIGKLCTAYVKHRAERSSDANTVVSIALRQREDRAILMVTDRLPDQADDATLLALRRLASGSGGRIWTQSNDDGRHGLVFSLPTRALAMEAMIMQSGGTHYGLAVDSMVMVHKAGPDQILRRAAAGSSRFLRLENGEVLTIVTLENRKVDQGGIFVIMQAAGQRRALLVDALVGHQVVRLRPLQGVMERLDRLSGFAVLAGGQIALVLSPLAICHDHDLSQMAFHEPEERHEICNQSPD